MKHAPSPPVDDKTPVTRRDMRALAASFRNLALTIDDAHDAALVGCIAKALEHHFGKSPAAEGSMLDFGELRDFVARGARAQTAVDDELERAKGRG